MKRDGTRRTNGGATHRTGNRHACGHRWCRWHESRDQQGYHHLAVGHDSPGDGASFPGTSWRWPQMLPQARARSWNSPTAVPTSSTPGNVRYLQVVRVLDDRLIVVVKDDASEARLKSPEQVVNVWTAGCGCWWTWSPRYENDQEAVAVAGKNGQEIADFCA